MSQTFLLNLMRIAYEVTKAERAFAVDLALNVVGTINIIPEQVEAPYIKCIRQAISEGSPIITDNYTLTADPAKAPVTNQSFPKLRFVVVLPVNGLGAICVDQGFRSGLTSKDKVDKLSQLVQRVVNTDQMNLDEDELLNLYNRIQS